MEPPAQQNRTPRQFNRPDKRENFRPKFNNANSTAEPEIKNNGFHDFHAMRENYRENNSENNDSFEKKMASFLKTSEAKITDLNSRASARSGRTTRRRNNRD